MLKSGRNFADNSDPRCEVGCMKKRRFSPGETFHYKFENFLSRGGTSIFLSLIVVFLAALAAVICVRAVLLTVESGAPSVPEFFQHLWLSFLQITDPGNMAQDNDRSALVKISAVMGGMVGVIIFSMLIAFITTQLDAVLHNLRKGLSQVIERDHTLILGWNIRVFDILRELIIANESERDASIAILADEEKEIIDDQIRAAIPDSQTTRIVVRTGQTSALADIRRLNAGDAKSAIVLADCAETADLSDRLRSDAKCLKTVLTLHSCNPNLNIVAELFFPNSRKIVETFQSEQIVSVDSWDMLGKILVQSSRTRGLSVVYRELLSFDGAELYFYAPEGGWQGQRFYDLWPLFADGVPIGMYRASDGSFLVRPPEDTILEAEDEIIIVAGDDSTIKLAPQPIQAVQEFPYYGDRIEKFVERQLIIGWHPVALTIIREYFEYLEEGSSIDIVLADPPEDTLKEIRTLVSGKSGGIQVRIVKKNPMVIENLESIEPYTYDNVIILSQDRETQSVEKADSETLAILFMLRQIAPAPSGSGTLGQFRSGQKKTKLITQVLNSENEELVAQAHVDDFLISNRMLTMVFAQLSENPRLKRLYDEIFSESGSEIYIKPARFYFAGPAWSAATGGSLAVSFADLSAQARKRAEICIGWRSSEHAQNTERNFGITINPPKSERITLGPDDALIVIAEDEL